MAANLKQKVGGALYPDEVALAAAAFQAALVLLGDDVRATSHSVRQSLAEYISAHALNGELDVDQLRDGALQFVRAMRPATFEGTSASQREEYALRGSPP